MEQTLQGKARNASLLSLAVLVILIWGFYRTYIMHFPAFEGFIFVQHFHGVTLLAWMASLIVQPLLIQRKKMRIHRMIGKFSFVLAPLLVISILLVSRMTYLRNLEAMPSKQDAVAMIALSVAPMLAFIVLYCLAIVNKKDTFSHMRYMIGTALIMIGPGLGRACGIYFNMPGPMSVSFTLILITFIALIFFATDLIKKRNYQPNLIVLFMMIFQSVAWELRSTLLWQPIGNIFAWLYSL
ncbi:MAG TPA: hypothetical protein PKJ83_09475 [Cyclobacteriaceae bacterium]|nr:hypothetical protein [Cyclobacteriaceae bacterium]HPW63254.1 hypothetical protein [Cyclobacteriaceae bacterium]